MTSRIKNPARKTRPSFHLLKIKVQKIFKFCIIRQVGIQGQEYFVKIAGFLLFGFVVNE